MPTHKRSNSSSDAANKELINTYQQKVTPIVNTKPTRCNSTPKLRDEANVKDEVPRKEPPGNDDNSSADSVDLETPRNDEFDGPLRLLLLSDKTPKSSKIAECCLGNVMLVQYKYDSSTLEAIMDEIRARLASRSVHSIAIMCHSQDAMIHMCSSVEKHFTQNPLTIPEISSFFSSLAHFLSDDASQAPASPRIDFLGMKQTPGLTSFIQQLAQLLKVPVGLSQDVGGCDIYVGFTVATQGEQGSEPVKGCGLSIGHYYFDMEKLRSLTISVPQTMAGFEKIRVVGKGAYGAAVLYRKKDDDSLVILKEINMIELGAAERQCALNEVKILSMLDHPNIISYYDSFEENGVLIIEMEYADGGTLAQFLASRGEEGMEEREILIMFQQMVAAMKHIHDHHVLHRDFKTENIFLMKEGIVKLGDFGISKMMTSTKRLANTVVGTPYYISPELCEGKEYNEKSDIWALGCVLYEMACQQRTFEGSNLPALVNKIMKGQFAPIKSTYSQQFRVLIRDMLQKEPHYRPSAHEILYMRLPELMSGIKCSRPQQSSAGDSRNSNSAIRSLLYELNLSNSNIGAIDFPFKIKIKQIASSSTHATAVTTEMTVFTWGDGSKGQLGHENFETCSVPTEVESLKGKSIVRVGCGEGFTVFGCDNGILLTSGDGASGCLGHGDWNSTNKTRLIESLLSVDVVSMACGPKHVAAVSTDGDVYCWGLNCDGQLGTGDTQDRNTPTKLTIQEPGYIREVRCGSDGTMMITDMGCVMACGNNQHNKLGLNNRQGFLMNMKNLLNKIEVEGSKTPVVVKCLSKHRVLDIFMGATHTAVIVEPGHVYMLGQNSDGQLAIGSLKNKDSAVLVKDLEERKCMSVVCGPTHSAILTHDNVIHLAGTIPRVLETVQSLPTSLNSQAGSDLNSSIEEKSGGPISGILKPSRSLNATRVWASRDSPEGGLLGVKGAHRDVSPGPEPDDLSGSSIDTSYSSSPSNGPSAPPPSAPAPRSRPPVPETDAAAIACFRAILQGAGGGLGFPRKFPLSNFPEDIGMSFSVTEPPMGGAPVCNPTPIARLQEEPLDDNPRVQFHKYNMERILPFGGCSLLLVVHTSAPLNRRRSRRRHRVKKQTVVSGVSDGYTSGEASATPNSGSSSRAKRSSVTSTEGEFSSAGSDCETDGGATSTGGLNDSDVPTWLRKEFAEADVVPLPSTAADSCYSSDEEAKPGHGKGARQRPRRQPEGAVDLDKTPRAASNRNADKAPPSSSKKGPHTNKNQPTAANSRPAAAPRSDSTSRGGSASSTTSQEVLSCSYSSAADNHLAPSNGGGGGGGDRLEPPAAGHARKGSGSGAARPVSSIRPSPYRQDQAKKPAPGPKKTPVGKQPSTPGSRNKPTAVVEPTSNSTATSSSAAKTAAERRLQEEVTRLRQEKADMELRLLAINGGTADGEGGGLQDELAVLRAEMARQRRELAENAAEMTRMQQQLLSLHSNGRPGSANSSASSSKSSTTRNSKVCSIS